MRLTGNLIVLNFLFSALRFYSAMKKEQQLVSLVEEKDAAAVDVLLARARPKFEAECQLGK